MSENILDKFLRYVKVDTESDPNSKTYPSTEKQRVLGRMLEAELNALGLDDVHVDEHGYVTATLPSNVNKKVPTIVFMAHMDTSPDMSGKDVKPQIVPSYNGEDILLNKETGLTLKVADFPEISQYVGQTIITTDGTTLLGADDKAGIAEIMSAIEYLIEHPEVKHGAIKVAFTHDEEIGCGVDYFDVKRLNADFGYTMDGGAIGELEFENFNAAGAAIKVQGRNIHPGYAKDKMLNAILIGHEFNAMLPINQRPEYTTGYDGFFHLMKFEGTVENASFQYIIRDHDRAKFEAKKVELQKVAAFLNERYGEGTITVELKDQYYNMREMVEPHYHIIENAIKAMEMANVKPHIMPIRGGTDGARLSFMGLPCPNIFAGGHNFHGKFEFIPLESMVKAKEVIVNIASLYAQ
jgi:tripeptide aminopeptidase